MAWRSLDVCRMGGFARPVPDGQCPGKKVPWRDREDRFVAENHLNCRREHSGCIRLDIFQSFKFLGLVKIHEGAFFGKVFHLNDGTLRGHGTDGVCSLHSCHTVACIELLLPAGLLVQDD